MVNTRQMTLTAGLIMATACVLLLSCIVVSADDSVKIWSMSGSQEKYCSPVVVSSSSNTGTIKGALIDLVTGQQVHIIWYRDTVEIYDDILNLDASPYWSTTFPDNASAAVIEPFNTLGIHTIKVEVWDTESTPTLLASNQKSYEIVSCSGSSLSLGPPSSQCLGVLPDNIPGVFTGDGSGWTFVNWTDDSESSLSSNLNEGSFNAVEEAPSFFLYNIYNTAGFHYLRLDAQLNTSSDIHVSSTVIFNIQICPGTYYVDIQNGSDSNTGTSASPWKTFHYAITRINGGGSGTYVLHVALGNYMANEEANAAIILSQSNVTIIGASGSAPVLNGTGLSNWTKGIKITGSDVTLKNLYITGFSDYDDTGIEFNSGSDNVVEDCRTYGNYQGINIGSTTSGNTIRGCESYQNDYGMICYSSDNVVSQNTVHNNTYDGVWVRNSSPEISRNKIYDNANGISVYCNGSGTASPTIKNNLIYENTSGEVDYGITFNSNDTSTVNPKIYHNTIDGGTYEGILIEKNGTSTINPEIKYNIVTNFRQYGIKNSGGSPTLDYNDVWHNGPSSPFENNYLGCEVIGSHAISQDPKYGSYTLQSDSPCIGAIPASSGDPVTMDYPGYSRPRDSKFDMGAYEYIATQTDTYTLPGGTGLQTDYEIFTVPLDIGTGAAMRSTVEGTVGTYNPARLRVFARTTSGDIEMNTQAFASLDITPGMGFWGITVLTDTISFQGTLAPDAIYYRVELAPGWNLFAVPWPDTSIELGKIYVTDGVNQYAITNASNTLTDKYIWDYTGTGSSGYVQRSTSGFPLVAGTGYFIKVLGSSNIILAIPPDNDSTPPFNYSASASSAMSHESPESVRLPNDPEPPPLPDGSYGPVPDIKANGKSGPLTVSKGTPVSIAVSLDPGNRPVKKADWWVVARTPFKPPFDWYSYVYPKGWQPGIHVCVQTPPFQIPPSFEVLNMALPKGDYTLYFALDENSDGTVDETWVDSVEVHVE